ncbi:MAG: P-II family nitrogen regulator [Clostridia bacterium]
MGFSRIEVITAMNKVADLQTALSKTKASGITVAQVLGCGVQNGTYEYEIKQKKEMSVLPKQMLTIIVEDEIVEEVLDVIKKELYTGHIGDGKIFVSQVTRVIRVRTGEEGIDALK